MRKIIQLCSSTSPREEKQEIRHGKDREIAYIVHFFILLNIFPDSKVLLRFSFSSCLEAKNRMEMFFTSFLHLLYMHMWNVNLYFHSFSISISTWKMQIMVSDINGKFFLCENYTKVFTRKLFLVEASARRGKVWKFLNFTNLNFKFLAVWSLRNRSYELWHVV